ncbi:MAG: aminoacyl-tRNA deacylase [Myxococcales bacterium]|jgi:Ala-tRNA(Pro) deacylase
MVPATILDYLHRSGTPFRLLPHRRAISAQELAASVSVTGRRVAKSVVANADGRMLLAVLPATELLDEQRLAFALGVGQVRVASERELASLFPGCELGAAPPFGRLFGLPVIVDDSLARSAQQSDEPLVFRAGTHDTALEIRFDDFARLEQPLLAAIARAWAPSRRRVQPGLHPR